MNAFPSLSIIIPTIGRDTLKLVLEALLLNKNFDQIKPEIIVVFDGKKVDREWLIVNGLEAVKVLKTDKKAYAAGARNLGLQHATGEVIAFIGDDTIPEPDWLERLIQWHQSHPQPAAALLGKVAWIDRLSSDPFHQWLERTALFDYAKLDRGLQPTWRHFYTSNVSVKKKLLANEKFSDQFTGWGFEDSEFGYRLSQRGMQLHYDADLVVQHDDPQTLEGVVKRTQQARANAKLFEALHPEVKIIPTGLKKLTLKMAVWLSAPFALVPKVKWWRQWKQAWLG